MELQLSSGQGPEECELGVYKLLCALQIEFPGIKVLDTVPGKRAGCLMSVRLQSDYDLSFLEGTIKWICQSPYRPKHKRKNWFIDVSLCGSLKQLEYDETQVRFETFRSSGKGGQHVNKVESGVRAIHIPTGLAVVSTDGRSQHMNKNIALNRLCEEIACLNAQGQALVKSLNRLEHLRIERGNPTRAYVGMEFKLLLQ
jgi:peptide chain release factor